MPVTSTRWSKLIVWKCSMKSQVVESICTPGNIYEIILNILFSLHIKYLSYKQENGSTVLLFVLIAWLAYTTYGANSLYLILILLYCYGHSISFVLVLSFWKANTNFNLGFLTLTSLLNFFKKNIKWLPLPLLHCTLPLTQFFFLDMTRWDVI